MTYEQTQAIRRAVRVYHPSHTNHELSLVRQRGQKHRGEYTIDCGCGAELRLGDEQIVAARTRERKPHARTCRDCNDLIPANTDHDCGGDAQMDAARGVGGMVHAQAIVDEAVAKHPLAACLDDRRTFSNAPAASDGVGVTLEGMEAAAAEVRAINAQARLRAEVDDFGVGGCLPEGWTVAKPDDGRDGLVALGGVPGAVVEVFAPAAELRAHGAFPALMRSILTALTGMCETNASQRREIKSLENDTDERDVYQTKEYRGVVEELNAVRASQNTTSRSLNAVQDERNRLVIQNEKLTVGLERINTLKEQLEKAARAGVNKAIEGHAKRIAELNAHVDKCQDELAKPRAFVPFKRQWWNREDNDVPDNPEAGHKEPLTALKDIPEYHPGAKIVCEGQDPDDLPN